MWDSKATLWEKLNLIIIFFYFVVYLIILPFCNYNTSVKIKEVHKTEYNITENCVEKTCRETKRLMAYIQSAI